MKLECTSSNIVKSGGMDKISKWKTDRNKYQNYVKTVVGQLTDIKNKMVDAYDQPLENENFVNPQALFEYIKTIHDLINNGGFGSSVPLYNKSNPMNDRGFSLIHEVGSHRRDDLDDFHSYLVGLSDVAKSKYLYDYNVYINSIYDKVDKNKKLNSVVYEDNKYLDLTDKNDTLKFTDNKYYKLV